MVPPGQGACIILTAYMILYRTKAWLEKTLANFTKSPNFICQTFSIHLLLLVFAEIYFTKLIFYIFAKLLSYTVIEVYHMRSKQ